MDMMKEEIKRLFFGVEVHAPWPTYLPKGRLLDESHRHLTLAFLGNIPFKPLLKVLDQIPKPVRQMGSAGYFDECLMLPLRHPHVAAWHARWWEENTPIVEFQSQLSKWLAAHDFRLDERPWKPHVTLCRQPFKPDEWMRSFQPLPFYTGSIHLYESMGNLHYNPIWSFRLQAPFEEIEHTADMAFIVRGQSVPQLYLHAFTALAFKMPELLEYFIPNPSLENLVDLIILLNTTICRADSAVGCPMKAVSFHGEIVVLPDSSLQWEMIVDV